MELPSKELLSEVLGLAIHNYKLVLQTSIIKFTFDAIGEIRDSSINIYELAHKCKEWSVKNGYGIASSIDGYYPNFIQAFSAVYKMHTPEENIVENQADTEPEVIFKACQWILDNKDK